MPVDSGGAVYWSGSNGTVFNSNFIKNSAFMEGGAVYVSWTRRDYYKQDSFNVDNCTFTSNTVSYNHVELFLLIRRQLHNI